MALLQSLMPLAGIPRGPLLLLAPFGALLVFLAAACGGEAGSEPTPSKIMQTTTTAGETITVHSSPTCGCCGEYEKYLEEEGFEVESVKTEETTELKDEFGVPEDMRSCHTSIVGEYFVEGHVPVEAIRKLLEEKPQIDGIALPRMPSGSPGMGGVKSEPFAIYSIMDGGIEEFVTL